MARPTKRKQINKKISESLSKMTKEAIVKLETAFSYDCSIDEACLYAGITPPTFYNWKKKNPKPFKRFELLRNTPILAARKRIIKGVEESYGNAMDYLSRKRKAEFSTKDGSAPPPGEGVVQTFNAEQITTIAKRAISEASGGEGKK